MTLGLPGWLKLQYNDLNYEVPVSYPSHEQRDHREWLTTNGLGGYAMGTVCGASTRRYHGVLVCALNQPCNRHIILSRLDEKVFLNGREYELSTNHWSSGVVAPTGYKFIESFTTVPSPTWVFNLDGHYLIKQLVMPWGSNEVHAVYSWLPDQERLQQPASIAIRFLTAYRSFHKEVRGNSDKTYPQEIGDNHSMVKLNGRPDKLRLAWNQGEYDPRPEWWWGFHWKEEAARSLPEQEDLYLLGTLKAPLAEDKSVNVCAGLNKTSDPNNIKEIMSQEIMRQRLLFAKAGLPRSKESDMLVLACDQFLVDRDINGKVGLSVIAGYPWFTDSGREAMVSAPGLTIATRRFDDAKKLLETYSRLFFNGLLPNRFPEEGGAPDYLAADTTLWWTWALYQYFIATKDRDFLSQQFPRLQRAAWHYKEGTAAGIQIDPADGLLRCFNSAHELTWMNTSVANFPITPRSGKPVELCALWYNFLVTLNFFAKELKEDIEPFQDLIGQARESMQKFWNNEKQCLYDVLEAGNKPGARPDDAIRPNQLIAVSLPFRAFPQNREKSILQVIDMELFTPYGLRTLAPSDPSYQGIYGCGFSRADEYHRDLSYQQGTVWPWFLGPYCEALLNVFGPLPETYAKIRILLQPLLKHLVEDAGIGSISEIFDGNAPHTARGAVAASWSVAELMRIYALVWRQ